MNDQQSTDEIFAQARAASDVPAAATVAPEEMMPSAPEFAEFSSASFPVGEVPISMLLDLSLPVSIELGRTSMTVQEILRLGRGAVVQLERLAGEPIDIYVGDRRFAEGEVVVLGEHFGVRVTRIISHLSAEDLG